MTDDSGADSQRLNRSRSQAEESVELANAQGARCGHPHRKFSLSSRSQRRELNQLWHGDLQGGGVTRGRHHAYQAYLLQTSCYRALKVGGYTFWCTQLVVFPKSAWSEIVEALLTHRRVSKGCPSLSARRCQACNMLRQLVIAVALLAAVALAPAAARPSLRIDVSCIKLTWPDCALHVECVQCLAFGRIQTCFTKEQAAKRSPRFFNCTDLPPAVARIHVNGPDGVIIVFNVELSGTTEYLKQKIEDVTGFPSSQLTILFKGKALVDGSTLAKQGVRDGSTLCAKLAGPQRKEAQCD